MGCQVRRHLRRAFRYRSFNPAPRLRPNAPKMAPFLAAPDTLRRFHSCGGRCPPVCGKQAAAHDYRPTYGVAYDPKWREEAGLGRQRQRGAVMNDDRVDWTAALPAVPRRCGLPVARRYTRRARPAMRSHTAGFEVRAQIIWAKQHFAMSRGHYHWQHEPCWYAVRKGNPSHWRGDRTQSTLWQVANLNSFGGNREEVATGHGTQKPVELMRRPMLNHTERGDLVYDPFLGSGTTLIAAALLERVCYGVEIDSRYVDVIVRRWQQITGQQATWPMTAGPSSKWNRYASRQPKAAARVNIMPTDSKVMKDRSAFYTITCQNCHSRYQRRQKPKERLCSAKCREQWRWNIEQLRAERPVTRRSTSKNIADDLGEFYEPGNPGNPVRSENLVSLHRRSLQTERMELLRQLCASCFRFTSKIEPASPSIKH